MKSESRSASKAPELLRMQLEVPTADADTSALRPDPTTKSLIFEQRGQTAHILAPSEVNEALPLLVVLHGAGKGKMWSPLPESGSPAWAEDLQVLTWVQVAQVHRVVVVYPLARGSTWDYIKSGSSDDILFIQAAMNAVRQAFPVDDGRIAAIGISDGGSMSLSLAVHNPDIFQAAISCSAGFCASLPRMPASKRGPKLFVKHGSEDTMFPLSRVGFRVRDSLVQAGYDVDFQVGQGEGHVPKGFHLEFIPKWLALRP
eukprot:TRINITY_DN39744_c0_g1_i1.p1 TRINITY_DN39744_c0_g1~~TRINITY_DN39744_c0_g1_i1.p1  ORF type:complete len:272 (+),score=33.70 TRINITY_DN39744_c0_g1_i1:43-816(+)